MTAEVLATILTGGGVVLTVLVSSFFNWKKVNVELNHLKQQNQLTYAAQILEKRHDSYPIIYKIIIGYINSIRARDIKRENLIDFYNKLAKWDEDYSIFLSARSQFVFFSLLKSIRVIAKKENSRPSWEERKNIIENIRKMELALKSDLGVFIVEFSGAPEGFFGDYTSLFEETKKEEIKQVIPNSKNDKKEAVEEEAVEERPDVDLIE